MADKTTYIKEAQKFLAKGQIDKAIAEWEKLVREYPDGNNFNAIGDLYLKKGDKKNAIESYHKAAKIFRQEGFTLKALALFKKVLNINPADAAALYVLGELSEEKALITDAIKYYLATADSLAKEGKKNELFDIYAKILSLSPSNIPLRLKVAEILSKEGLKSDAAKEYLFVAGLYDEKGDIEKAKEYYRKSFDMNPVNRETVLGLSSLYEKTGEADRAIVLLKEAAVLLHDDVEILIRSAEVCLRENVIEQARSCLLRANEIDPKHMKSRMLLGEICAREGLREKAWDEYRVILDDLIAQDNHDEAITLLERFKDIDPPEAHRRLLSLYKHREDVPRIIGELTLLGDLFFDRGEKQKALSFYAEALERAPGDSHLQERVSELHEEDLHVVPEFPETGAPEELFEDVAPTPPGTEDLFRMETPADSAPADFAGTAAGKAAGHISLKSQKAVDEIFTEADIFFRYGLLNEALELLDGLRSRVPENIDLHLRLKNLYTDLGDKASMAAECLMLAELYRKVGDTGNAEKVLRESGELSLSGPGRAEKDYHDLLEPTSFAPPEGNRFSERADGEAPAIVDYEEELAEADFYARQGLIQDALKILLKLRKLFPENRDVAERLEAIGEGSELSYPDETPETPFELTEGEEVSPEHIFAGESPGALGSAEEIPDEMEYEEFSITEDEIIEAQQMPEQMLDNDVLEVFKEFKKGLEHELEDEDSETHYNLGIAYKEMGLVDDAIKEFQTARNDAKRFLQSSTMLGICYMEKGLYSLAIDVLSKTLANLSERDDTYWSVTYDLAEAYEKNNNLKEAAERFTAVFGWNAKFRDVAEKVGALKAQSAPGVEKEKTKERKDRVSYL